jgi:hypothetical protein
MCTFGPFEGYRSNFRLGRSQHASVKDGISHEGDVVSDTFISREFGFAHSVMIDCKIVFEGSYFYDTG